MKCSVELPTAYLDYSDLFDYDFVIASVCLQDLTYYSHYKTCKKRYTILDNGAFENKGNPLDTAVYYEVIKELKPDVVVIPDVLRDQAETAKRVSSFLDFWKTNKIEGVSLMGVLQGTSPSLLKSLHFYYQSVGVSFFGLPYINQIDRFQFLRANPHITNVHILGAPNIGEVTALATLPQVVSIDTSLPVRLAVGKEDIRRSFGFPYNSVNHMVENIDRLFLRANIEVFVNACHNEVELFPVKRLV